jgi:hypothetical protein
MRSLASLRSWMVVFLPTSSEAAREGAWQLVRAMLVDLSVNLCQLARQLDRETRASSARQYLLRWLSRDRWQPEQLYAALPQCWPRELRRIDPLPLLFDCTVLGERWCVLQVSVPWQRRALPVYRAVVSYRQPEAGQTELVHQALAWLRQNLPPPHRRYVVVMDRGFPSQRLIQALQAGGWRYVLRIGNDWRVTHADYTGPLAAVFGKQASDKTQGLRLAEAVLGSRRKGPARWSRTHVVVFHSPEHRELWALATSEATVTGAVAIYRQRMQIEAEFRDLKGPLGLDHLRHWRDRARVARLLAWIAIYEWRLALLWLRHELATWGKRHLQVGGSLSWIWVTRAWARHQLHAALGRRTRVRESP